MRYWVDNTLISGLCFIVGVTVNNVVHRIKLPVTMLMSSSWLRWLDDDSDRLELAELNGWSDGHGEGGPPLVIKRANVW